MSEDKKTESNIEDRITRISNNFESDILRLIKTRSMIKASGEILDDEIKYLKSKSDQIQEKLKELNLKTNELKELLQITFQDKDLSSTHVGTYLNEFISSMTKGTADIKSLDKELSERLNEGSEKLNSLHKFYIAELEAFQHEVDSGLNVIREEIKEKLEAELKQEDINENERNNTEPASGREESIENEEEYYQKMFSSSSATENEDNADGKSLFIALGILVLLAAGFFGYYFKYLRPGSLSEMTVIEDLYSHENQNSGDPGVSENGSQKEGAKQAVEVTRTPVKVGPGAHEESLLSETADQNLSKSKAEYNSSIVVKRANIRIGPGRVYDVVASVNFGTPVASLNEESGIWMKVRLQDGKEGWVAKKLVSK